MVRDDVHANASPLLVVANPRAGRGRAVRAAAALARELRAASLPFTLATTRDADQARELAAAAAGPIVAVGGDGTVHAIVGGLRARDGELGPLAVLPAGSGDDFARNGDCARSPAELVARLRAGRRRTVDVGLAEFTSEHGEAQRRFVNDAGLGFEADVVAAAAASRWLRGRALYLAATLRALRRQRTVECDFEHVVDGAVRRSRRRILFASACNGACVGGGLHFAPGADPADGRLDVLQVDSGSRRATLALLLRLLRGRHTADPRVELVRCAALTLRPAHPLPLSLDGESIAARVDALTVRIAPERLVLIG